METIIQKITDWLKELLIKGITDNLSGMFDTVNQRVGEISTQVGTTPSAWNGGVFSMIQSLSETVIIPIAGVVLTFIMCYELISMVIDRNNLHDVDSWMFFRWIFKTFCAVLIVTNTWDIIMGIFDVAQSVVNRAGGVIASNANIDISSTISTLSTKLEAMELGQLIGLYFQSMIVGLSMSILSVCIFVIVYGRMVEIYLTASLGPIPLSTMVNREWSNVGQNYLKSLLALGFQAFLIMVCVGIYAVLVQSIAMDADIMKAVWTCMGYTVLLCFTLFKTGSLSKSIFSAH